VILLLIIFVLQPDHIGLTFICAVFTGLGIGYSLCRPFWAVISDLIREDKLVPDQRREGFTVRLRLFSRSWEQVLRNVLVNVQDKGATFRYTITIVPDTGM
jgi:Na+/melibiose symporter-like transporter